MWEEQWRRIQRWYADFEQTERGRDHRRESDSYLDEAYAFFQNCHHLKDWLQNDPSSGVSKMDAEALINGSEMLRICADLANGSKHLKLRDTRTGDRETKIGRRRFFFALTPTKIAVSYEVRSGGSVYDAFNVAEACMAEWTGFLTSRGLLR